jgi:hypothetical protein
MSKNSSIQNYTQLTEWLSTLKTKRSKPVKSNSRQPNYSKADAYNQRK